MFLSLKILFVFKLKCAFERYRSYLSMPLRYYVPGRCSSKGTCYGFPGGIYGGNLQTTVADPNIIVCINIVKITAGAGQSVFR